MDTHDVRTAAVDATLTLSDEASSRRERLSGALAFGAKIIWPEESAAAAGKKTLTVLKHPSLEPP
jgi:hypothetical protein